MVLKISLPVICGLCQPRDTMGESCFHYVRTRRFHECNISHLTANWALPTCSFCFLGTRLLNHLKKKGVCDGADLSYWMQSQILVHHTTFMIILETSRLDISNREGPGLWEAFILYLERMNFNSSCCTILGCQRCVMLLFSLSIV